ncbi:hypothetical protein ACFWFS_11875 [Streptomyces albidoflavus]
MTILLSRPGLDTPWACRSNLAARTPSSSPLAGDGFGEVEPSTLCGDRGLAPGVLLPEAGEFSGHPLLLLPQERQRTPGAGLPGLQLLQKSVRAREPVEQLRDLLPLRSEHTYVVPCPGEGQYHMLPGLAPQRVRLEPQHLVQAQHRIVPVRL